MKLNFHTNKKVAMKNKVVMTFAFIATFILGFAFKSVTTQTIADPSAARVTGIGGIFFKCQNPAKMREWYNTHLGFTTNQYGAVFEWRQGTDTTKKGFTQWSPFSQTTSYFAPSTKEFMINYRVNNLEKFVEQLKSEGVTITDKIEVAEYGKFVHIMDIEGNKIELWEPNDIEYEKLGVKMKVTTIK